MEVSAGGNAEVIPGHRPVRPSSQAGQWLVRVLGQMSTKESTTIYGALEAMV